MQTSRAASGVAVIETWAIPVTTSSNELCAVPMLFAQADLLVVKTGRGTQAIFSTM